MVHFDRLVLPNGLRVILHQDDSTPLVAVNLLFGAGSKYDPEGGSGLAHLFEHLMFSGTPAVPDFDTPIQMAGAENNAFTNCDHASYFSYGPAQNLETFLWLEADRLRDLVVTQEAFDIQQHVVIEELYESCLNVPYGDVWHHLLPAVYPAHPYARPTIGISEQEIAALTLDDAQRFYQQYYHSANAVLSVSGNFQMTTTQNLITGFFGDLRSGTSAPMHMGRQESGTGDPIRLLGDVPVPSFYIAFQMPSRDHPDYIALDLVSDLLAMGRSSLLYRTLVKEMQILSTVDAYVTGTLDCGLLVIEGRLANGSALESVTDQLWHLIEGTATQLLDQWTMEKLKNTLESNLVFSEISSLNKAMNLCFYEWLGDIDLINREAEQYQALGAEDIRRVIRKYLVPDNATILSYEPAVKAQV